MTKPMVLCIERESLQQQNIPYHTSGIFPFNLSNVSPENFHFLNRKLVDNKDNKVYQDIAYLLPQILPYITVMDTDGKYLTYSRNGTETRLHGSRSIGIGGHVDIDDHYNEVESYWHNFESTIAQSCKRELEEEISWKDYDAYLAVDFDKLIVDTSNPVGKVHVGLFTTLVYPEAKPQEELHDPQWLTVEELKANIDQYENWSKLIIGEL